MLSMCLRGESDHTFATEVLELVFGSDTLAGWCSIAMQAHSVLALLLLYVL